MDEYVFLIDQDSDWMAIYKNGRRIAENHESAFDPQHLIDVLFRPGVKTTGGTLYPLNKNSTVKIRLVEILDDQDWAFPPLLSDYPGGNLQ